MQTPVSHRDLVTAYLLAMAGLPFTLRVDAAGKRVEILASLSR